MSKNILLISDTMIKEKTALHGNVDPKLLYPEIKLAQDMFIHPLLGTALFDKIQELIEAGSFTSGAYKDLLDDYIVDTLMNYVLAELPETLSYQFYNKGVLRKTGDNTELPSMSDLASIASKYKKRAEWYATRLKNYLREVSTNSLYPEYLNPGNGCDDIQPTKQAYTCPIVLDDDYECKRSLEERYQGNKPSC